MNTHKDDYTAHRLGTRSDAFQCVFTVTFQATGRDTTPAVVRLKRLLKSALRGYGLRCIEAKESPAAATKPRTRTGRAAR